MKKILRNLLINMTGLYATTQILFGGVVITDELRGLFIASLAFMLINILLVPLIKILFLPLNLLTLGLFAWLTNVVAFYFLTVMVPTIKILPFYYQGWNYGGFVIPGADLTTFQVTIVASFMVGFITHFFHWLST